MPPGQQQWIGTLISFGILALVIGLRMRRMQRSSQLKVERLWMLPAFYALVVAALFWAHPPHGISWLYILAALLAGIPLGWYRGKLMRISVDPQTHEVSQQGSLAAMLFILLLVGLRYGGRQMALQSGGGPETIVMISDMLLASALGFIATQRLEMGLRARRLIDQARRGSP